MRQGIEKLQEYLADFSFTFGPYLLEELFPERSDFSLELHILLFDLDHVVDLLVLILMA